MNVHSTAADRREEYLERPLRQRPVPSRGLNAHQTMPRWLTDCIIAALWVSALIVTVGMFYGFAFVQAPLWMTPLAAAPSAVAAYAHLRVTAGRNR